MKRIPIIGLRKPIINNIVRSPIFIENPNIWYDVYKFEGIYQMNIFGNIRKNSTKEYIPIYTTLKYDSVVLRHPSGDGSSLSCRLIDVWDSTILEDHSLDSYSYIDSI